MTLGLIRFFLLLERNRFNIHCLDSASDTKLSMPPRKNHPMPPNKICNTYRFSLPNENSWKYKESEDLLKKEECKCTYINHHSNTMTFKVYRTRTEHVNEFVHNHDIYKPGCRSLSSLVALKKTDDFHTYSDFK